MPDPQIRALLGIVAAFSASTVGAVHHVIGPRLDALESRLGGRIDRLDRDLQAIAERAFRERD